MVSIAEMSSPLMASMSFLVVSRKRLLSFSAAWVVLTTAQMTRPDSAAIRTRYMEGLRVDIPKVLVPRTSVDLQKNSKMSFSGDRIDRKRQDLGQAKSRSIDGGVGGGSKPVLCQMLRTDVFRNSFCASENVCHVG